MLIQFLTFQLCQLIPKSFKSLLEITNMNAGRPMWHESEVHSRQPQARSPLLGFGEGRSCWPLLRLAFVRFG